MAKYLDEEGVDFYYTFPIQHIIIPEYGIDIRNNYGYCSFYFPYSLQREEAFEYLYLIKVYKYFTEDIDKSIEHIQAHPLLFGESLHPLYIPQRGEGKWIRIGKMEVPIRKKKDIPNYKECSLGPYMFLKERNWWILKNGGFLHHWSKYEVTYEETQGLEFGDVICMINITERIYLLLILEHLSQHKIPPPPRKKMEAILFPILRKEPIIKRWKDEEVKDAIFYFIDRYYEDFVNRFEWNDIFNAQLLKEDKSHEEYQLTLFGKPEESGQELRPQRIETTKKIREINPLDEDKYWAIIQESLSQTNTQSRQKSFLVKEVAKLLPEDIAKFQQRTNSLLNDSYTSHLWCAAYIMNGGCSDDCFDYFRCWLISQGKEVYYKAMNNPDSLIDVVKKKGYNYEFEAFWYIGMDAYEKNKINNLNDNIDFENFRPNEENYPEILFDWDEDDEESMAKICPKLAAHFFKD